MSEPAKDKEKEKSDAKPKKGGGGALTMVLVLLNLGGTGFLAWKSLKPQHVVVEAAPPPAHKEEAAVTAPLDPFVVNLNEPGSSRYLKATFELEVAGKSVVDDLEQKKRAVRDDILRYLSSLTIEDTQGEAGKTKIQENIIQRGDKLLGAGKVKRIYFNEFVVQ